MNAEHNNSSAPLDTSISRAESELDRLIGWVRAAESRLALVLPLSTAMLGTLAVLSPPIGNWTIVGGIAAAFASFLLFLSIIFSACASFPRTAGPKGSLIYFGGIISRNLSQYQAACKSLTAEEYLDDLLSQCHRNAQIAERKYVWIQASMGCLFVAALPWGTALFILYSGKY